MCIPVPADVDGWNAPTVAPLRGTFCGGSIAGVLSLKHFVDLLWLSQETAKVLLIDQRCSAVVTNQTLPLIAPKERNSYWKKNVYKFKNWFF